MRIAMIGQKGIPATYGGIERHVEEIGARLAERGHDVTVFSRWHYTKHSGLHRGMRIKRLPTLNTKHLDTISHCMLSVLDTWIHKYDIVHFHALGPSLFSGLPRIRRAKTVVTIHGLDWQRGKWGPFACWFLRHCERPSVQFPDRTIVVSKALQKHFREEFGAETFEIPNGTNPPVHRPPNKIRKFGLDRHRYVLFVGRLVPEKGCHILLEAFRKVDTDARLVMAGGSSFSDGYIDTLHRLRDGDERIHMLGYVYGDMLDELWSNAYLVVQPSFLEGFSISLVEAMSHGKCVLASDIPENLEVVEDCAATFKTQDAADLQDKLQMLLDDPIEVDRIARRCRSLAQERFSWPRIVEATEAVYLDALGVKPLSAESSESPSQAPDLP
ncbi:MAG: glycosyltransferase [Candidatus Eisenbacteria bacterium]|nr:glycosyltransferase [Candidatus Latescibacterota bacterium]MBD3301108.1 glycosyltransferase [Candidatus Eisenbacteria bacterium]